jgi:hypothetical protein
MVLWANGGVYMDAKLNFIHRLDWIDWENDEFILCPSEIMWTNNGTLFLTKYHPLALLMIMETIKMVEDRRYPFSNLDVSGPEQIRRILIET